MQLADLDAVLAIEAVAFPTPWARTGYEHELQHNERASYYVLLSPQEQIIGYAGQWLVAGEAHVSIMAVDPAWRGRGLGALLLQVLIEEAQDAGVAQVLLEVREHNDVAQQLYRRFRFVEVGRRHGYYKDTGEDALLMTLEMDEPGLDLYMRRQREQLAVRLRAETNPPEEEE